MPSRALKLASFLFFSGMCSLIYETVWIRELRLVFGASTSASAAVVACFIGGLGAGGILFGRRADRHPRPLAFYATLETAIALSAALSPFLLGLVRAAYVALGGSRVLGVFGGATARLVLAAVVFAVPTIAMGGTLPAIARAAEDPEDHARRSVAFLYGVNTLGAVTGCIGSTFLLFEVFGTRMTLWLACLVNLLVAVVARGVSRTLPTPAPDGTASVEATEAGAPDPGVALAPRRLILAAAAITGFVFTLMELVWYRMLAPLLGGTVFTFGLILAVALAGIGLGGTIYAVALRGRRATLLQFAWTCLVEALAVAAPYAYGDRLAVLAAIMRPVNALGFATQAVGWTVIASLVVFPAAIVTGAQFPLLIALLGTGEKNVGRDVGHAYAFNTAGAIVGSLAGGFGLLPQLGAPGCWRLVAYLLAALGIVALSLDVSRSRRWLAAAGPSAVAFFTLLAMRATGPTAAWRHSPIGAGRVKPDLLDTRNDIREWLNTHRRVIVWEADGRESTIGLDVSNGLAFIVNGKNDGNAREDGPTTVALGLLGALFHPHPTRGMVIGLGTGASAGWLAAVPSMTDVDVAELEPAVLEVARRSAPINAGALDNPKVHVVVADAREALLTSRERYDLIASEPSNPYRAGVSSLFTREFYQAAASRLAEDGIFLQWVQGYEVDGQTIRSIYATLMSAFPEVETWELMPDDLLLVASKHPLEYDVPRLRNRLAEEPFRSAFGKAWRAQTVEAMFTHFIASSRLSKTIAEQEGENINTDDMNIVEYGFARAIGNETLFSVAEVRTVARGLDAFRPALHGDLRWEEVDDALPANLLGLGARPRNLAPQTPENAHRLAALDAYFDHDYTGARKEWTAQPREPQDPTERLVVAMAHAEAGEEDALKYVDDVRAFNGVEADLVIARLRMAQGKLAEAADALTAAYVGLRTDPWAHIATVVQSFKIAHDLAAHDKLMARRMWEALRSPFSLRMFDEGRLRAAIGAAVATQGPSCVPAFEALEPYPVWAGDLLVARAECYRVARHPLAARALDQADEFTRLRPPRFAAGLH